VCESCCCGLSLFETADNGADNNDHGQYCFQTSGPVAWLKKQAFKKPDKVPRIYDQPPFFEQIGLIVRIDDNYARSAERDDKFHNFRLGVWIFTSSH